MRIGLGLYERRHSATIEVYIVYNKNLNYYIRQNAGSNYLSLKEDKSATYEALLSLGGKNRTNSVETASREPLTI